MYFSKQKFLVFGLSVSGVMAAKKLLSLGAKTYIFDEDASGRVDKAVKELLSLGAEAVTENVLSVIKDCDVIVLSPGVRIDHPLLVSAKKAGKRVIGELEFGSLFMRAPMVAVTGTNGKTTTCSMISAILDRAGVKNKLLGNYGVPLTLNGEELGENDVGVVEVSSFQLETVRSFTPHIAVELNVTSDHLDRHYTRENYIFLKSRLLSGLRESEYAVLNFDDETTRSFGAGLKAKVVWFSRKEEVDGAFEKDGAAYYMGEKILDFSEMNLSGDHNRENALAAIAAAKLLEIENEDIARALKEFKGVRHRLETVAEINGVKFINDSKATNVDSTIKALSAMTEPTVIILGGKGKNEDYKPLFEEMKNRGVKCAVLTGEECYKLLEAAKAIKFEPVILCEDFDNAVKISALIAESGDNVLLSPAAASFDRFFNYEERGEEFARIVGELR